VSARARLSPWFREPGARYRAETAEDRNGVTYVLDELNRRRPVVRMPDGGLAVVEATASESPRLATFGGLPLIVSKYAPPGTIAFVPPWEPAMIVTGPNVSNAELLLAHAESLLREGRVVVVVTDRRPEEPAPQMADLVRKEALRLPPVFRSKR
jgi:hypothetical protein